MQVQILVQYVNHPKKPGGKFGNIKSTENAVFWVPAAYLGLFQQGQPANVVYTHQTWGDMGQVAVVTSINGQDITGQQGPVQGGDRPAPIPQNVPQNEQRDRAPHPERQEDMFVMGVVGRAIGSGQFGAEAIDMLAKAAVAAWRDRHTAPQTFEKPSGPPSGQMPPGAGEPPFNDDLPEQYG